MNIDLLDINGKLIRKVVVHRNYGIVIIFDDKDYVVLPSERDWTSTDDPVSRKTLVENVFGNPILPEYPKEIEAQRLWLDSLVEAGLYSKEEMKKMRLAGEMYRLKNTLRRIDVLEVELARLKMELAGISSIVNMG